MREDERNRPLGVGDTNADRTYRRAFAAALKGESMLMPHGFTDLDSWWAGYEAGRKSRPLGDVEIKHA